MDTTILPLAEAAGLRVGERVDVLLFSEGGHERMEVLTDVRVKRERGRDWLVLEWAPGAITPWGTESCGHGGYLVDDVLLARLRAMTPNASLSRGPQGPSA